MPVDANHDETKQALAVVEAYFNAAGPTSEAFWGTFNTFFDEATVWENVGMARTVGRDEAVSFARSLPVVFDHMRFEVIAMSASGNRVHAERLDHFCTRDGKIILTVRAHGIFEVREGKFSHWRDYFDTAGVTAALGTLT